MELDHKPTVCVSDDWRFYHLPGMDNISDEGDNFVTVGVYISRFLSPLYVYVIILK